MFVSKSPRRIFHFNPGLNDETILQIADKIGEEYARLGVTLGLSVERIQQIEYNHPKIQVRLNMEMLTHWRDSLDDKHTEGRFLQFF